MTRKTLTISGSDCTGADTDKNRTYALPTSSIVSGDTQIFVQGVNLYQGASKDFTMDDGTITFLNRVFDVNVITIIFFTILDTSTGNLKYSSVLSLVKHLEIFETVPNRTDNEKEEIGTGNTSDTIFWISKLGVIENTYTIFYGSDQTTTDELTETTHYVIDLDTSQITLTAAGITLVADNKLFATYSYNNVELLNSEMIKALTAAETKVELFTEQRFANFTDDNPAYRKVIDEQIQGHYQPTGKVFEGFFNPWVELITTVNGEYTTGGTEITLTDASGFPEAGTIYIGGNKVAYSGKSTNTLTIPSATPSIDDEAVVRGEVIEVSDQPEGAALSFTVLDPELKYKIDYLNGHVNPLPNAFWGEISANARLFPSNYVIRVSYFSAWHEDGTDPIVRDDVQEVVNMIAAKKFVQRMIKKAHIAGMNDFKPDALNSGDADILMTLEYYKPLNVGGSMHDKQEVSGNGYGY